VKHSNMTPTPVPKIAKQARPWARVFPVGPPIGISDNACGTVEAMHDVENVDGVQCPVYRDYWKPSEEQLKMLNEGGFIELAQYAPQMIMHAMTVWEDK